MYGLKKLDFELDEVTALLMYLGRSDASRTFLSCSRSEVAFPNGQYKEKTDLKNI